MSKDDTSKDVAYARDTESECNLNIGYLTLSPPTATYRFYSV